ncbi:MAG: PKD domain-containing protein [Bacteroidales bacterium]|nr:PKD domain-containing protein [Bacteroidales bacterium]
MKNILKRLTSVFVLTSLVLTGCNKNEESVNSLPTVVILSPLMDSEIEEDEIVNISIDASDPDGNVTEVRFYVDNVLLNTIFDTPFTSEWNTEGEEIGDHIIKVRVLDDSGEENSEEVNVVLKAKNVNFSADYKEINQGRRVQFTDKSIYNPVSWSWDFGDGETSNEQNPNHLYFASGHFTVSLTVEDDNDIETEEKIEYITVNSLGWSTGIVLDVEGNSYKTIKIGNQWWMAENLRVTKYSNGTEIELVEDENDWSNLTINDKAYCYLNNTPSYNYPFGVLYTWAAAMNGSESSDANPSGIQGVCPSGWHLPGDAEWKQLEYYLGMSGQQVEEEGWRGTDEGGKLKEKGNTHWLFPNTGATNETGFSALPGGDRYSDGTFNDIGLYAIFWSATEYDSQNSWRRVLSAENSQIYRTTSRKRSGFSVRCIKD